jgi:two-component system NtrC family sensor kinase
MPAQRILIISDKNATRTHLQDKVFKSSDYEISTGDRAATISGAPDVILLGEVEDEDSLKFAEILIEKYPAASLILMLNQDNANGVLMAGMRLGAFDCLSPKASPDEIKDSVLRGVQRSQRIREWARSQSDLNRQGLETRISELETIFQIGQSVTSNLNLDEVLSQVVQAAVKLTGAEEGSLLLLDDKSEQLYMRAAFNFQDDFARTFRLATQDSLAGQVIQSGEPLLLDRKTPEKIKTHYLVHSLIYVPLKIQDRTIGVLGVDNRTINLHFANHHIMFMTALADFATVAIENATLYSQTALEREKLETMMRRVADGVILIDENNNLLLMNESALEIFDIKSETEIQRQSIQKFIDHEELLSAIHAADQEDTMRVELALENGRFFIAQVTPIHGVGKTVTMQDVTHFKELDNIKTEFVHTVSHDLRSPLTAILGYVELIKRAGDVNEVQKDYIERVHRSVKNITDLINALLELGRIEAGFDQGKEIVPLSVIIEYATDGLQFILNDSSLNLKTEFDKNLLPIYGNPIRIRQLITNLLDNAIHYTPEGGTITIRLRAEGNQCILQVEDSGIGIPTNDQPYIFDKLYRASNVPMDSTGSGLGLSIVRSIVENHNGRLWFNSTEGEGTIFTVVFPFAEVTDHEKVESDENINWDDGE